MTKLKQCKRCGRNKDIERHHIKPKSEGGKDEETNYRDLCKDCHDFTHAQMAIKKRIAYYEKRLKLLKHRLSVCEELNSRENIVKFGYRTYWVDETTHGDRKRSKYRRKRR